MKKFIAILCCLLFSSSIVLASTSPPPGDNSSIVNAIQAATSVPPIPVTPAVTGPNTLPALAESVIAADESPISGTCASSCNGALLSADLSGYNSWSYQITSGASGAVVTAQSCDAASLSICTASGPWVTNQCVLQGNPIQNTAGTNSTLLGSFSCQKRGEFVRLLISGYTSGTITVAGHLHAYPVNNLVFTTPLPFVYTNITTDATTTVKSVVGLFHGICINTPVATETITMWDNTSAAGNKIGTITIPASPVPACYLYDVNLLIGLTIVTAVAASDITVMTR